jgi:hypothetical protein
MAGTPNVAHLSLTNLGDTWEVSCEARSFTVRDSKGMRILARLVAEPGRELHVLDLVDAPPPGAHRDAGDAGEMLDEQARRQYRERVAALRAELQEAESFNDLGRGEHLRSEIEAIGRELSRAVGLGGRARRSGAAAERARVNVQRRLRDAIKRIAKHDPALEKHLNWAVKTGAFCRYDPS